jgi:hypothetical protein
MADLQKQRTSNCLLIPLFLRFHCERQFIFSADLGCNLTSCDSSKKECLVSHFIWACASNEAISLDGELQFSAFRWVLAGKEKSIDVSVSMTVLTRTCCVLCVIVDDRCAVGDL